MRHIIIHFQIQQVLVIQTWDLVLFACNRAMALFPFQVLFFSLSLMCFWWSVQLIFLSTMSIFGGRSGLVFFVFTLRQLMKVRLHRHTHIKIKKKGIHVATCKTHPRTLSTSLVLLAVVKCDLFHGAQQQGSHVIFFLIYISAASFIYF